MPWRISGRECGRAEGRPPAAAAAQAAADTTTTPAEAGPCRAVALTEALCAAARLLTGLLASRDADGAGEALSLRILSLLCDALERGCAEGGVARGEWAAGLLRDGTGLLGALLTMAAALCRPWAPPLALAALSALARLAVTADALLRAAGGHEGPAAEALRPHLEVRVRLFCAARLLCGSGAVHPTNSGKLHRHNRRKDEGRGCA